MTVGSDHNGGHQGTTRLAKMVRSTCRGVRGVIGIGTLRVTIGSQILVLVGGGVPGVVRESRGWIRIGEWIQLQIQIGGWIQIQTQIGEETLDQIPVGETVVVSHVGQMTCDRLMLAVQGRHSDMRITTNTTSATSATTATHILAPVAASI
mmetsp:Transcript_28463/g.34577  ORF Transcript_28463/g.34577 Transcript_28463/m.34577 type:complete len:151 (-) Transcript_28463:2073-2525(-)